MKSFPINKIVDKIILNVMVAPSLLESLTSILTSEGCWKNQLKSYNLFFFFLMFLFYYLLFCFQRNGTQRVFWCVSTQTHKFLSVFTSLLSPVDFLLACFWPHHDGIRSSLVLYLIMLLLSHVKGMITDRYTKREFQVWSRIDLDLKEKGILRVGLEGRKFEPVFLGANFFITK